ncbi:uncharacterized protein SPAPADRAFT_138116 [Spathaspora passalidarum NRRL Y-27907]|uniref:Major facilitator superfamily (MFS) profile domain-containing protein n=1 Tax=Spathaspora passalidarum (strain NRRL Y-27907 / 11-Y1) TaxID=619300 RepID=G3AN45_SPAPN|nr:uncharacterized protein SPAPADRAFT_138116 [Spathaspora passalidarum NRRL Y-27907]EGW32459.1 hypothetical protein SPAPADRAFT_138116 [Spathaspora passalidarum NRRL Y-27907]
MKNKIYNSYAIGVSISTFCLTCGMEMQTYLTAKSSKLFAAIFTNPSKIEDTILSTSNPLGAIFGSIICGQICHKFGFIRGFQVICLLWIIGIIIAFFSSTTWLLIIARVVKGVAIGFTYASVPIYIYETIPPNSRGRVLSIGIFCGASGNLITFSIYNLIEEFVKEIAPIWTRLYWSFGVVPVVISFGFTFLIPESPKWLATNSKWETAADVLQSIQLKNSSGLESKTKDERIKLGDKHFVIKEYTSGVCVKSCSLNRLFGKKYIKELVTAILIQFFLVFTFITKLQESFDCICNACQLLTVDTKLANLFDISMRILFACFPIVVLDILRRKDILVFAVIITTGIMIGFTILFLFFSYKTSAARINWQLQRVFFDQTASFLLALTVLADVIYTSILLPSCWLLTIETFSSSSRIQGWVVSTCIFWILETITSLVFPFLLQILNEWLFLVISIICIVGLGFSIKLAETKGKSGLDSDFVLDSKSILQLSPTKSIQKELPRFAQPIEKVQANRAISTYRHNTINRFGSKNASLGSKRVNEIVQIQGESENKENQTTGASSEEEEGTSQSYSPASLEST